MKNIRLLTICLVVFYSCRKTEVLDGTSFSQRLQASLTKQLLPEDRTSLDFAKTVQWRVDSAGLFFSRVPFRNKNSDEDFVIVKTSSEGEVEAGKIVHLEGKVTEEMNGTRARRRWDGSISIHSFDHKKVFASPIENGFITALHPTATSQALVQPANVLPEVIITYRRSAVDTWSSWGLIQSFFYDSGWSWGNLYGSMGNEWSGGGGGSGGGSTGGRGGPTGGGTSETANVDFETDDLAAGIELTKYLDCFSAIPDVGAVCTIEILTDIPVDGKPYIFYDFKTGSPGHAFVSIRKINGAQSVTQNIGFYPKSGYKASTYAPTAGKFVDNAGHEFNASLTMNLTAAELTSTLNKIRQTATSNYDVDGYNCTDWALDIFNHSRTNPIQIPFYGIPGSQMTQSSRTPQGLYQKLQQMASGNDPEKANVTIGIYKGYAGGSKGPCN